MDEFVISRCPTAFLSRPAYFLSHFWRLVIRRAPSLAYRRNVRDFADVFDTAKADAALAASIFHFKEIAVPALKQFLINKGIPIRI